MGLFQAFFIVLVIVPYRFYRFEVHLSNRFYRASINRIFFIGKNDNGIYRYPQEFAPQVLTAIRGSGLMYCWTDSITKEW